jgi:hypothetical protein
MYTFRGDLDPAAIVHRYVGSDRSYMMLLHGTILTMDPAGRAKIWATLAPRARQVTDDDLDVLFDDDWRSQLTAAWLAGLTVRTQYRERIAALLIESRLVYAGQGFCFALARFGTSEDARVLAEYSDRYLPQHNLRYDQQWAFGALLYLDGLLGTREGDRFLGEGGPWALWARSQGSVEDDPQVHRDDIRELCSLADECMRSGPEPGGPT